MTPQPRRLILTLDHHHRVGLRMLHRLELGGERLERNRVTLAGQLHRAELECGRRGDLDRRRPSFARRHRGDQRTDLDRGHLRELALHLLGGEIERTGLRKKNGLGLRGRSLGIDEIGAAIGLGDDAPGVHQPCDGVVGNIGENRIERMTIDIGHQQLGAGKEQAGLERLSEFGGLLANHADLGGAQSDLVENRLGFQRGGRDISRPDNGGLGDFA